MASPTSAPTQTTVHKMKSFIAAFDEYIEIDNMLCDIDLEIDFVPPSRFPRGMKCSAAYSFAKDIVNQLKACEEPRLLGLEPLCKLPDEDVNLVGESNKKLLADYLGKKKEIRSWRKTYFLRLKNFIEVYNMTYSYSAAEKEEYQFFLDALDEADDKDLSFCLTGKKIGSDVELRD